MDAEGGAPAYASFWPGFSSAGAVAAAEASTRVVLAGYRLCARAAAGAGAAAAARATAAAVCSMLEQTRAAPAAGMEHGEGSVGGGGGIFGAAGTAAAARLVPLALAGDPCAGVADAQSMHLPLLLCLQMLAAGMAAAAPFWSGAASGDEAARDEELWQLWLRAAHVWLCLASPTVCAGGASTAAGMAAVEAGISLAAWANVLGLTAAPGESAGEVSPLQSAPSAAPPAGDGGDGDDALAGLFDASAAALTVHAPPPAPADACGSRAPHIPS